MASDEVRRTIIIIVGALVGAAVQMILSPNALDVAKSGAVGNAGLLQKRCEPLLSSVAAQYNFPHVALTLAEYHEGLREASEVLTLSPLKTFRVAFVGSLYCHNAWEALTILEPRLAGSSNGSSISSTTALEFVVTPDTAATLLDPSCEFLKFAKGVRVITGLGANTTAAFPADHFDWIFFSSAFVAPAEDVAILEDRLARWWPKLRPGGLFSGDHFNDPTLRWIFPHWGHHGPVVTAVSRFAAKTSGRLNPTQNSVRFLREGAGINRPHSPEWYMMKPSRIYTLSCRRFIVPANAMVDELPKRGAPAVTEAATSVSQQELWRLGEKTLIPTDEYDKSAPLPGGFKYGHPAAAAPRHAKPRTTKK